MTQIVSGIPLFAQQVNAPNTENRTWNVIFNASSESSTSHLILVDQTPIVVRAFGLSGGETITLNQVSNDGIATLSTPAIINGKTIQLSVTNTMLVIDISGNYTFTLSAGLGTVSCVCHPSGMSYWSYGLSDFSAGT